MSPAEGIGLCSIYLCLFVGGFYVGPKDLLSRDDERVIKKRFLVVGVVSAVCPVLLSIFGSLRLWSEGPESIWYWLGVRSENFGMACCLPVFTAAFLFLAPLVLCIQDIIKDRRRAGGLCNAIQYAITPQNRSERLQWVRNIVVGPITEEIVFRACVMGTLLHSGMDGSQAVWLSALFFSGAHAHHVINWIRFHNCSVPQAILQTTFHMSFTFVFGLYVGFIFLRTRHLIAAVSLHMFCNAMGFPNFSRILRSRVLTIVLFVGVGFFAYTLRPLTSPSLYASDSFEATR
eukprot:Rmarinus@m.28109